MTYYSLASKNHPIKFPEDLFVEEEFLGRWSSMNRGDFLGRALGRAASFYVLPPGAALAGEFLQPQMKFAPFQFPDQLLAANRREIGIAKWPEALCQMEACDLCEL